MLAEITVLLSTLFLAGVSQGFPDSPGPYQVEFREVVPGVTLATRPGYARLPVQGNMTVISNRDDVVVEAAGEGILVPGHGDVLRDRGYLRSVIRMAEEVNRLVTRAVHEGADLAQTRERVDVGLWKDELVGEDPVLRRYFDLWFVDPAVERAFSQEQEEREGSPPSARSSQGEILFSDDFEDGLVGWELYGTEGAQITESGDPEHGRVLDLKPNGDVHALIRGSEAWGRVRMEGEVLFPEDEDNYLGLVYDFQERGGRMDFGNVYIKGNGSYLQVNPHRDYNVGRTLYPEQFTYLEGEDAIRIGEWKPFRLEVVGPVCHVYVGDMSVPKITFPYLELRSGALGLQPRSVGGDVWVDNLRVTAIDTFAYRGPPRPEEYEYDLGALLTDWEVLGPLEETRDDAARFPNANHLWRSFPADGRGAVVTGAVVDTHGPRSVAYFRTRVHSNRAGAAVLNLSTIDDLAIWVSGRFHWFVDRDRYAWFDVGRNPEHEGQEIPIDLVEGENEIVIRVRGGVYASGGFYARLVEEGG